MTSLVDPSVSSTILKVEIKCLNCHFSELLVLQSLSLVSAAQRSLDQKSIHIAKYEELQQDILHMTGYILRLQNLFLTHGMV